VYECARARVFHQIYDIPCDITRVTVPSRLKISNNTSLIFLSLSLYPSLSPKERSEIHCDL